MKAYFCIGSYYGGERLKLLQSELRARLSNRDDYSILVNEQGGLARKPAGFAVIYNALLNAAFEDPACDRAWILGDDVYLPASSDIGTAEGILLEDSSIGAIFPVEAWSSSEAKDIVTILPFEGTQVDIDTALIYGPELIEQVFAGFACACISRDAWRVVGQMDPTLGLGYAEDLDWGLRCWKAGYRIVNHRRTWFLHERGATYNQFVQEGLMSKEAPYDAARRCQEKWPFLWRDKDAEIMARLKSWYREAWRI